MIKWKDDYNIGINVIDEQHKKLFEIANRAYDVIKNDFYIDKYDKIVAIIEELKDYTKFHFTTEEEYMLSINYKRFFSQKMEHDKFIEEMNKVNLEEIDINQDKYLTDLLEVVVQWISNHILEKDMLIGKV